jgi:hypothetical protein
MVGLAELDPPYDALPFLADRPLLTARVKWKIGSASQGSLDEVSIESTV